MILKKKKSVIHNAVVQESSYYKMRRDFFEQRMGPAQTTGRRDFISCMITRKGIPSGAIEGIFKF